MFIEGCDVSLHVNKKHAFTAVKNNADGLAIFYLFLLVAIAFTTGFLNTQHFSAEYVMSSTIMKMYRVRKCLFISTVRLCFFSVFRQKKV